MRTRVLIALSALLVAVVCVAQYNPPVVNNPVSVVQNWPAGTIVGQALVWNGVNWLPGTVSGGISGTNVTLYTSGSPGLFGVVTAGGITLQAVSNSVILLGTNIVVSGSTNFVGGALYVINPTANTNQFGYSSFTNVPVNVLLFQDTNGTVSGALLGAGLALANGTLSANVSSLTNLSLFGTTTNGFNSTQTYTTLDPFGNWTHLGSNFFVQWFDNTGTVGLEFDASTNATGVAGSVMAHDFYGTNITDAGFSAVGVVTNTAAGKLMTSPTLPSSLLGSGQAVYGGCSGIVTVPISGTYFMAPNNDFTNFVADSSGITRCILPAGGTLANLYVITSANPGAVANTFTIMTNGTATSITTTLNNVTANNDTTHQVAVAAGVEVGIKLVTGAGTAVKWGWGFQLR